MEGCSTKDRGSAPRLAYYKKHNLTPAQIADYESSSVLAGNSNAGHEWEFYPTLTDDERFKIIEFLKTYTSELFPTGKRPPAGAPAN